MLGDVSEDPPVPVLSAHKCPQEGADVLEPWHLGSNVNPRSRSDCICYMVFTIGGFADEHGDIDTFIGARKASQLIMSEWGAAYHNMLSMDASLPERISSGAKTSMEQLHSAHRRGA